MVWTISALAFAVLWVFAFYREDRRREAVLHVIAASALGALALIPASYLEGGALLCPFLDKYEVSFPARASLFLLIVGPVEELVKFLPILLFFYPRRWFDEPMDGIVYSAAAATGFATAENFKFYYAGDWGTQMMFLRTPGAPLLHILFAGYWGLTLGWATTLTQRGQRRRMIVSGLVWGAAFHGLFNTVAYSSRELSPRGVQVAALILVLISFLVLRWHMRRAAKSLGVSHTKGP